MLKRIYEALWPIVKGKCRSLEEAKAIHEKLVAYIRRQYTELATNGNPDELYITEVTDGELANIDGMTLADLDDYFSFDEAFSKFMSMSSTISDMASKKKNGTLEDAELSKLGDYDTLNDRIGSVFEKIKKANKEVATDVLSEMLDDIDFIFGKSNMDSEDLEEELDLDSIDGFDELEGMDEFVGNFESGDAFTNEDTSTEGGEGYIDDEDTFVEGDDIDLLADADEEVVEDDDEIDLDSLDDIPDEDEENSFQGDDLDGFI
jgi:hypothetical protein